MWWISFLGGFAGSAIGLLVLIGGFLAWDQWAERRNQKRQAAQTTPTLHGILESHLEQHVVTNFESLFPGWQIYDEHPKDSSGIEDKHKPTGIRYRTPVDRYIAWVQQNLAESEQRVKGLIIAKSFGSQLAHTLSRRRGIRIWTYHWLLRFDKRPSVPE